MPLQKHELFTRSKCPNCLPGDTHRGALGAPSSGTAARPRRGIQINLGRGSRSSCRVPGGPFRAAERAAVSSLRAPLCRDASEITPSAGRTEPWGRGIPGEWGPELWASSLAQRHPGDTGAPSSRHHACVDSCEPSGVVPRRPRRPGSGARGSQAGLAPRMPPPGGLTAGRGPRTTPNGGRNSPAQASGTECPERRGPSGPPHPRPRRRPARGGVNKRRKI